LSYIARSPVFKSMFSADMKETKDNVVELIDIGEEALKVLFVYIYSGELNLKNKSTRCLAEVVNAADKVGKKNTSLKSCNHDPSEASF